MSLMKILLHAATGFGTVLLTSFILQLMNLPSLTIQESIIFVVLSAILGLILPW